MKPARARALAVRSACKALEWTQRAVTRLRRLGVADPTRLLLDLRTSAQLAAEGRLEATPAGPKGAPEWPSTFGIAVFVPFRDGIRLTERCVLSLLAQQLPPGLRLRLVLLDNGSVATETAAGLARLEALAHGKGLETQRLRLDEPFNYSRLNNRGVAAAADFAPDWLLFLNNDVEFRGPTDLARLLAFATTAPSPGAVGCTLDYPDGRVQHLFAAPGVKIVAAHPLRGQRLSSAAAWFATPRAVAAVTGAVLLVAAKSFAAVAGFDEALPTVGQDIDLCLALQKLGLINWTVPSVRLVHHEGASRGGSIDRTQVAHMYAKWGEALRRNPYLSASLSRFSEQPAYRMLEPAYPWQLVLP